MYQRVAAVFQALSHPVRLEILRLLADKREFGIAEEDWCDSGELCVCRIGERFELSPPALSHHLSVLRHAGLVATRRDGARICYRLRELPIQEAAALLASVLEAVERRRMETGN